MKCKAKSSQYVVPKARGRRRPLDTHMRKRFRVVCKDPNKEPNERAQRAIIALQEGDEATLTSLLDSDSELVPPQWQKLYKTQAARYWDRFYVEKSTNFFKDRNYLREEFQEFMPEEVNRDPKMWVDKVDASGNVAADATLLEVMRNPKLWIDKLAASGDVATGPTVLEVGCAVGNSVLPLLRCNRQAFAYACDISDVAVELLRNSKEYCASRCVAFPSDITRDAGKQPTASHFAIEQVVPAGSVDFATMVFILSAIAPEDHISALQRVWTAMRPGALLFFRDYGFHDLSMLRFHKGQRLGDTCYVRGDGTLTYFFKDTEIQHLCEAVGFETVAVDYVRRKIINHKRNLTMCRVWVTGKFRRPVR